MNDLIGKIAAAVGRFASAVGREVRGFLSYLGRLSPSGWFQWSIGVGIVAVSIFYLTKLSGPYWWVALIAVALALGTFTVGIIQWLSKR